MTDTYDLIVIGAGPAGENVADIAVRAGLSAAIVEKELVGGECSYWACMPSKALLRPGEVLDMANRAPGVTGAEIDVEEALERRNALASNWEDDGQVSWLEGAGVELIRGHGRLSGERQVEVEAADGTRTTYRANRAVVVATGTGAAVPPVPGLREVRTWDNREITTAKEVPYRLLVIGGGVVGTEMAQAWKLLGADEVTLVEMEDTLLPREEPFAGTELAEQLERFGIRVLTSATLSEVEREADDAPVTGTVQLADGSTEEITADEIVVATGRRPLTDDLGLDTVGLEPGGYLEVDDHLRVEGVPGGWLYAVGDVNGRALLTHSGKYQARAAGAHIAGDGEARAWGDRKANPRVVFTTPQVAAVGLTEAEARDRFPNVHTVSFDTGSTAGSAVLGKGYSGTAQLVVDADRGVIVGATFVGATVGELLHSATVAIAGEVPLDTLWHAIPSFPTVSEVWLRLLETYRDEQGHEFH